MAGARQGSRAEGDPARLAWPACYLPPTAHCPLPPAGMHDRGAQVIACPDERYAAYCGASDFIREHIFPGGHLPSMGACVEAARGTGLSGARMLSGFMPLRGSGLQGRARRWRCCEPCKLLSPSPASTAAQPPPSPLVLAAAGLGTASAEPTSPPVGWCLPLACCCSACGAGLWARLRRDTARLAGGLGGQEGAGGAEHS